MNNSVEKELPSEIIQREYEMNPSFILKKIRENDKSDLVPFSTCKNQNKNIISNENSKEEEINSLEFLQLKETTFQGNINKFINYNNNRIEFEQNHHKKEKDFQNILKVELSNSNNSMISTKTYNENYMNNNTPSNIINKHNFLYLQQNGEDIENADNINNKLFTYNTFNLQSSSNNNLKNHNLDIFTQNNREEKELSIIFDVNKVIDKLKNYWGSIFLQKILLTLDNNELTLLLFNILPQINIIMCSEYGNYFFQKLIKRLNLNQRILIYQRIEPYFVNIAKNKSGTHSIQSIIDEIKAPIEQSVFDNILNKNLLFLFNDKNAYHIIMKIILEKPEDKRNYVNLTLIENIGKIGINPYGAYCVNKFIYYNTDINLRNLLLKYISYNIKEFVFHKCSCSILLLLFKYYNINSCKFILHEIENNLKVLIRNHVALSFICKILLFLKNNHINILNSFISNICKNDNLLKSLLSNNNGRKLLNKIFEYSNDANKNFIVEKIKGIKDAK